jgi:hypothetical protein
MKRTAQNSALLKKRKTFPRKYLFLDKKSQKIILSKNLFKIQEREKKEKKG